MEAPGIAIAPEAAPLIVDAVVAGGGRVVAPESAVGSVWTDPFDADGLAALLARAPGVRWVQLPFAGVDAFLPVMDSSRVWTSAKGAYAPPVAEHAVALGLAGLRCLPTRARAHEWGPPGGKRLMGGPVTIVGGGSIAVALLELLAPFRVEATVVRRHVADVPGAARVIGSDRLRDALPGACLVVLALALTPDTVHIIGADELALMDDDAWLVNVARGPHVDTDALVAALRRREIGGAALDVTDPEPLPADHPLWDLDNCLITPHTANTWEMAEPLFAERVRKNVERFAKGEPLLGQVDLRLGY